MKINLNSAFLLIPFLISCGQQPAKTLSIDLSIPGQGNTTNKASSSSYSPIHVYLRIEDDVPSDGVLFDGAVALGNYADGTYTFSPTVTLAKVNEKARTLIVKGHMLSQLIQAGGTVCSPGNSSSTANSAISNDNSNVYSADFDANPLKYNITTDRNQVFSITPTLNKVTFDKFALKVFNTDGSLASANYSAIETTNSANILATTRFKPFTAGTVPLVTTVTLVDSGSNQEIMDPCTGLAFSGRTDTNGRVTTNFPVTLTSQAFIKPRVTQFTVTPDVEISRANLAAIKESTTQAQNSSNAAFNTYTLTANPITTCGTATTAPNNADSIPMFWNLKMGGSTASPMTGGDSYLASGEAANTGICSLISNNFNPRYANLPATTYTYLQPFNPYPLPDGAVINSASPAVTTWAKDLVDVQLLNPAVQTALNPMKNKYTASLIKYQQAVVKCNIRYGASSYIIGSASTYSDCTSAGSLYGKTLGLYQYFAQSSQASLIIKFYYTDAEDFYLYNNISGSLFTGQPTVSTNISLTFYYGS